MGNRDHHSSFSDLVLGLGLDWMGRMGRLGLAAAAWASDFFRRNIRRLGIGRRSLSGSDALEVAPARAKWTFRGIS